MRSFPAPIYFESIAYASDDLVYRASEELQAGGLAEATRLEIAEWVTGELCVEVEDIVDYYPHEFIVDEDDPDLEGLWYEGELDIHLHYTPVNLVCFWPKDGPNMSTLLYRGLLFPDEVNTDFSGDLSAEDVVTMAGGKYVPKAAFANRVSLKQAGNGELVRIGGPHSATPMQAGLSRARVMVY